MPYATQADMQERFGSDELRQLTDRALPSLGAIDTAVLARVLTDADGIVNRHLGARYTVPMATVSADIVRVCCDIARYLLHDLSAPELVRDNYTDALRYLRDVAEGKLPLVGADGAIVAPKAAAFGPGVVRGYSDAGSFGSTFQAAFLP